MKVLKTIFFWVTASFAVLFSKAQQHEMPTENYRAVHWTIEDGLRQERWFSGMIKDVKGFMWFGSEYGELNRFDGNRFQQFEPTEDKPGNIKNNRCNNIVEDSLHNIWIGGTILSRYDIKADTFASFLPIAVPKDGGKGTIIPFWASSKEIFCIESYEWITSFDIHSLARKKLLYIGELVRSGKIFPYPPRIYSAIVDSLSNSIWILPDDQEGLVQISMKDGGTNFYERPSSLNRPTDGNKKDAEAMTYDRKRNCIWINCHDGLSQFTLSDHQFHGVKAFDKWVDKKYQRFVGIAIDLDGKIWTAATPYGILIYDPVTQEIKPLFSDPVKQKDVALGNLKIYCDKDGIIWTSYWSNNGIYELTPHSQSVQRYQADLHKPGSLKSIFIENMMAGKKGNLWIGTQFAGLYLFDRISQTFQHFSNSEFDTSIKGDIIPMAIDTIHDKLWVNAIYKGNDWVFELNLQTKQARAVTFKDSAGLEIRDHEILHHFCPLLQDGCLFYDHKYGFFEIHADSNIARLVIPFIGFIYLLRNAENKIFITTYNDRLTYTYAGGKWLKTHCKMDSIAWSDIFYDRTDHSYWVGMVNKIMHLDENFREIRSYTSDDNVIGELFTILPDNKGNIWFNNGQKNIGSLNIKTGAITMLDEADGYKRQSYDWTTQKGIFSGGELYFPGNSLAENAELDRISPDKFSHSPPASVYIRSLEVNHKALSLPMGINNVENLSLRYFENKIVIETGIINHYIKGKSRIRYKLDKQDSVWQYAPYYYTINYEELQPGKYALLMQASNGVGEFNGPIKSLHIVITPAFWNTWWFRIFALLTLGLMIYAILRWRLQQKFRLQLERSEKEMQIAEMKQKATELEMQALRAQMNPHFIFNSLNSINRFILQNNKSQASEYLTKFSKLVRLILQNSQASTISLESELESLELYLNLEALRFNYHFDYKITVPSDLDIEVLKVPPLILQPYVENAIWHGLMHKEDRGQLSIAVTEEGDCLYFRIRDNGIGRKQAAALASKSATKHKSMGLQITAHRIAILQKNESLESPVSINDLVNSDGTAAGTEVVIKMPIIYD